MVFIGHPMIASENILNNHMALSNSMAVNYYKYLYYADKILIM